MSAPLLFGIDPSAEWEFVPAAAVAAGLSEPSFTLRTPTMGVVTRYRAVRSSIDSTSLSASKIDIKRYMELDAKNDSDEISDTEKAELGGLRVAFEAAYSAQMAEHAAENERVTEALLDACVVGWKGLATASGKELTRDACKGKLSTALSPVLDEIVAAILKGAVVTHEDAVGLPSPQASQSA